MTLYVNDEAVDEQEINAEVERLRPQYEQVFADQTKVQQEKQLYEWSRENVIERVLIRQAAFRDGEFVPPDVIEQHYQQLMEQHGGEEKFFEGTGLGPDDVWEVRKDIERRMRVEGLLEEITGKASDPSEKRIRACYDDQIERFTAPEMVRAAHIVKHPSPEVTPEDARAELGNILAEIREKDNFDEIAAANSDCPDNAGDLGYFPRGQMVDSFEDVVFNMEAGQVSDVFETEFGIHIAKLHDKRPSAPYPYDQVRETIARELTEQMRQKAIEDFVDKEKETAVIEDREPEDSEGDESTA
jgi:parvulin-like peptidyl-prolyl isomerase